VQDAQVLARELLHLDTARGRPWMVMDAAWVADRIGLEQPLREYARGISSLSATRVLTLLDHDFESVVERSEQDGRLTTAARARLRAAERLISEGRRAEADIHLQKALAFYRSVGATRYIREGEALLAAAS